MTGFSGETMFRKLTFAILTFVLLLAACGQVLEGDGPTRTSTPVATSTEIPTPAPTADTSIILTDDLGRTVTLAGPAQRIISLAPSNTEILFAIGAGAQVVGRDETSDYPEEAKPLPTVGGWSGFSSESIVALHPDLVLAADTNPPELVASLENLGLTVYRLPNPLTLEELYANLGTVGALTGHETDAAALDESLKARVAAVDAKIATVTEHPTVYYELDATDPTKPYIAGHAGPTNFVDPLITRAGGANIGAQLQSEWPQISLEQLVSANPQIILLGDAAYGETPEKVATRTGWNVLTAVQTGRLYPIDYHLVSIPGPRLVDGLEALAKLLHPDLFK
jgi:iron complex transport system substrate-binding protein